MSQLEMTEAEREAYLADVHVGIVSIGRGDKPPLTVPVWYGYEPGGPVWFVTADNSLKAKLLDRAGRFSLCAQTEDASGGYKYVSVEGPVISARPAELEKDLRPLAHRYLGAEQGDAYIKGMGSGGTFYAMSPERWRSEDYAKLARS